MEGRGRKQVTVLSEFIGVSPYNGWGLFVGPVQHGLAPALASDGMVSDALRAGPYS